MWWTVDEPPLSTDSNHADNTKCAVLSAEDSTEVYNSGQIIPENVDQTMETDKRQWW